MIPPDNEIYEVEQRIAARRARLAAESREAGRRAMQKLASPVSLVGAAVLGFLAASAMAKRQQKPQHPERRKSDHIKAAKATGITGVLLSGAMWYIRAQWGSPMKAAQALLEKWQKGKARPSPRGDKVRSLRQVTRP